MTPARYQDENLLRALNLLRSGFTLSQTARRMGRDPSNISKAVRAVLRDDLAHDDPFEVLPHYPNNIVIERHP